MWAHNICSYAKLLKIIPKSSLFIPSYLEMDIIQGAESLDLFWLFTYIRTERVRKLFIDSLILNEFSCCKVQIPCLHKQQTNIEVFYVTCCSFLHSIKQGLEVVWKNTASIETALE